MRSIVLAAAAGLVAACAPCRGACAADRPGEAEVRVDGRLMTVNGQGEIPRGLFGVHAVKLTPQIVKDLGIECFRGIHFIPGAKSLALAGDGSLKPLWKDLPIVIDCQGDRYCPATVLTNRDYAEHFRKLGRQYARRCKEANWHGYVEFWNEPYLNWASRSHGSPRNHYHNRFYEVAKAKDGGRVTIKGWDKPLEHLRWKRIWARDEKGKIAWGVKVPEALKPGDTFRSRNPSGWYWTDRREQTFTVVEQWHVHDPTQVAWWSGRQNRDFYLWMFLPFAQAVKQTHPDVQVIAGWDWGFSHGNWSVWRELYEPVIDAGIRWIDGLSEHHYGVDTRAVPAWYEVAVAYTVSRHGKWTRCYNTECGGKLDPAVYGGKGGRPTPPPPGTVNRDAASTYMLRDILELACRCPGKVGSRTAHAIGAQSGEAFALRLLRDLRGRLVRAESGDPDVWPVASLSGDRLVTVLFNNARAPRRVAVSVSAPRGTTLRDGRLGWIESDAKGGGVRLAGEAMPARGRRVTIRRRLGPRQALKIVLPLAGKPPAKPQLRRRQYFAKEGVLHRVQPGKTVALHVAIGRGGLDQAESAWVRLVLEGVAGGQARLTVNGRPVAGCDRSWTTDLPLDPKLLKADNEIVFTATGDRADGCQVDAASLIVETSLGDE